MNANTAAPAEPVKGPSDADIDDLWDLHEDSRSFARALLARYGQPAASAEPVAWQLHLPDGRVTLEKSFPAWADGGDGYAIRPLFAAPVAAQAAGSE
jgi:hypothetical protein